MGEKCGLLVLPRTVPVQRVLSVHCPSAPPSQQASKAIRTPQVCYAMYLEPQDYFYEISARFSYLTSLLVCQSDVNKVLSTSVNKFLLIFTDI
jgi:hypothetical protein